jgi:hypothetical protein
VNCVTKSGAFLLLPLRFHATRSCLAGQQVLCHANIISTLLRCCREPFYSAHLTHSIGRNANALYRDSSAEAAPRGNSTADQSILMTSCPSHTQRDAPLTALQEILYQKLQFRYKKKIRGLSPRANCTDRATAACR